MGFGVEHEAVAYGLVFQEEGEIFALARFPASVDK